LRGKNAPNSISAEALCQTPLGDFTALPQTPIADGFKGRGSRKGIGKGDGEGGRKGEEGERKRGRKGLGRLRHGFWGMDAPDIGYSLLCIFPNVYYVCVLC